jgi:hypothetical protein
MMPGNETVQIPATTLARVFVFTLPLKLAFTIVALVNDGMSDWFIHAHTLK